MYYFQNIDEISDYYEVSEVIPLAKKLYREGRLSQLIQHLKNIEMESYFWGSLGWHNVLDRLGLEKLLRRPRKSFLRNYLTEAKHYHEVPRNAEGRFFVNLYIPELDRTLDTTFVGNIEEVVKDRHTFLFSDAIIETPRSDDGNVVLGFETYSGNYINDKYEAAFISATETRKYLMPGHFIDLFWDDDETKTIPLPFWHDKIENKFYFL